MFFDDTGALRSLLARWTTVMEPDAFAQCAAGGSRNQRWSHEPADAPTASTARVFKTPN